MNLSDAMDRQLAIDDAHYALDMLPALPAPVRRYLQRLKKENDNFLTFGQGGADFNESQLIGRLRGMEERAEKAERQRDASEAVYDNLVSLVNGHLQARREAEQQRDKAQAACDEATRLMNEHARARGELEGRLIYLEVCEQTLKELRSDHAGLYQTISNLMDERDAAHVDYALLKGDYIELARDQVEAGDALTMDAYHSMAMRTCSHDQTIEQRLANAALGLCGEAGEVAEHLKKVFYHGHALDRDKLLLELGDVLWYVVQATDALGAELDEVARLNIDKLTKRYPGGFSAEASQARVDESEVSS